MGGARLVRREWTENLVAETVRLRCSYERRGKQVLRFTVQLEARWQEEWRAIERYGNAHGFCHRDTVHADGTQDKTAVFVGDVSSTFSYAIEDLKANWRSYQARFIRETKR